MINIQLDPSRGKRTEDGYILVVCKHFRPDLLQDDSMFDMQVESVPEKPGGGHYLYAHPETHDMKWVKE